MKKIPKPRPFAEVARDVAAARAETPMQGLSEWLREHADDDWYATTVAERLLRWASEVEAARASLPAPENKNSFHLTEPSGEAATAQPVAWGVFAMVDGEMTIQYPVALSPAAANAHAAMYGVKDRIEVRPLFAGHSADNASLVSNEKESDAALLRQCLEALECLAIWAKGSEAYPRLLNIAAKLRERLKP